MGVPTQLEIHTRSLCTFQTVRLVVEDDDVCSLVWYHEIFHRFAVTVHHIVAPYDRKGTVDDNSLINEQTDACILIKLPCFRIS